MKIINNLNQVDSDKILFDQRGVFFIIISIYLDEVAQLCTLNMLEIDEHFTNVNMTVPIAANKNNEFISVRDSSFVYKLTETELSKKQLAKEVNLLIKDKTK